AVVEFLSYEGAITAVGGPADGMTSTDIGVEESSTTLVGESLQRTTPEGVDWFGPSTETRGAPNEVVAPPTPACFAATPDITKISCVQGSGSTSPVAGQSVTVTAVVTENFTGDAEGNQLGGFFIEEETADRDSD